MRQPCEPHWQAGARLCWAAAARSLSAAPCCFTNNSCLGGQNGSYGGGSAFGGALYTVHTATLNQCEFSSNHATGGSGCYCSSGGINGFAYGGAVCAQGTLQILHSTFADNWVDETPINDYMCTSCPWPGKNAGGALFSTAICGITNSTWYQNRAVAQRRGYVEGIQAGAAIYQSNNPIAMVFCTIASNTVVVQQPTNTSAAIVIGPNALARLSGCVLAGNTQANLEGNIVDDGFNLSSDHSVILVADSSRNDVDPKLGGFGNHGGPTRTLSLLIESPAIDAVPSGAGPATDQRGVVRPNGTGSDIGAFEYVWPAPVFTWEATGALRVDQVLPPSRDYQVDASFDLVHWILLSTMQANDQGQASFTDTTASSVPFRFYRTRPQ